MSCISIISGMFFLSVYSIPLLGQNNWVTKNDLDGIKISTRKDAGTSFDDTRVELDVPGKLEQLKTIIFDVNKYSQWIYSTKKTVLIKQARDCRCIYFTEMSAPWPFSNRYYYSDLTLVADSVNHSFHVVTKSIEGHEFNTKGLVKITYTRGEWHVSQKSVNSLHIDYTLELDPGGTISPWLFNMFLIAGPRETFEKIRKKMTDLNHF
jgi:hypothetical protein